MTTIERLKEIIDRPMKSGKIQSAKPPSRNSESIKRIAVLSHLNVAEIAKQIFLLFIKM